MVNREQKQRSMLVLNILILFFLFAYARFTNESRFLRSAQGVKEFSSTEIVYNPDVEKWIENSYFADNALRNGDFSQGRDYWSCFSEGGECFAEDREYLSAPRSLRIEADSGPVRIYYSKKAEFIRFSKLPWEYRYGAPVWLGIHPAQKITAHLYYKGARPTVYLNLLKKCGNGAVLVFDNSTGYSPEWEKIELAAFVPPQGRAVSLEITLNDFSFGKVFFIDDVSLEVTPCGNR